LCIQPRFLRKKKTFPAKAYPTSAAFNIEKIANLTCVTLFVPQNNCDVLKPSDECPRIAKNQQNQNLAQPILLGSIKRFLITNEQTNFFAVAGRKFHETLYLLRRSSTG